MPLESQVIDVEAVEGCVKGYLEGDAHVRGDPGACQIDPRENIFRVFTLATYRIEVRLYRVFCKHDSTILSTSHYESVSEGTLLLVPIHKSLEHRNTAANIDIIK